MSKIVVVPEDYDTATSEQVVELKLTAYEFEKLWNEGVFALINKISDSNIDDYEDEHITDLD